MRTIKIYSKDYTELTTFFESETENVSYKRALGRVGEAEFTVRLDNDKSNNTNLQHFNRIVIAEDGDIKFWGIILEFDIDLDIVRVRCKELTYVLEKRIVGNAYATNGAVNTTLTTLLNTINAVEDTGISIGSVSVATAVNKVFNYATVYEIINTLTEATSSQFVLRDDRSIDVLEKVGTDLSETVIFQYDENRKASSNILGFKVIDSGDAIVTRVQGKSGVRNTSQENSVLKSRYGLLEKFKDFRVANSQTDLDEFANVELRSNEFSPDIQLAPSVADNFEVGDTVRILIKNKLVNIDNGFQVLEKTVQYLGNQKRLSVVISDLPTQFIDKVSDINARLQLLEQNV